MRVVAKPFCLALLFGLTALLGLVATADANAPAPPEYLIEVQDNTVFICTTYGECPSQGTLLREGAGEEVVSLSTCGSHNGRQCYVDECVPAGSYRYGLEAPYECSRYYDPPYYGNVVVTSELDQCERTLTATSPEDYADPVPWLGQDQWQNCDSPPNCSIGGAADPVFGLQLLALCTGVLLVVRRRASKR